MSLWYVVYKVPHIMKTVRADKGAIPFVLSGANVMCPGLTSAGGDMPEELEAGTPVVRVVFLVILSLEKGGDGVLTFVVVCFDRPSWQRARSWRWQ